MKIVKAMAVGALSVGLILPGAAFAQNSDSASNSASTSQSNSASNSGGGSNSQNNSSSTNQNISQHSSGGHHHHRPPTQDGATPLDQISSRLFLGSMLIGGNGGWTGTMSAKNPACTYTMNDATPDSSGGFPMSGAGSCGGNFDLMLNSFTGNSGLSELGQFDVVDMSTGSVVTTGDYDILYGTATPNTGKNTTPTNLVIKLEGLTTQQNIN